MKLLKEHTNQYLVHVLPDDVDENLDTVSTISDDGTKLTISIVNKSLYDNKEIDISLKENWKVVKANIVTCDNVRTYNTFEQPYNIKDGVFTVPESLSFAVPKHSVVRICLKKA